MPELPANIPDIIKAFVAWYIGHHKANETAYAAQLSRAHIESMNDAELVKFFFQFAKDGGKLQSGGYRTAPLLRKTIDEDVRAFRAHILQPFVTAFDVAEWLAESGAFKGWGKGVATIYLNRVDPKRFVVVNNKSVDAYEALGYPIRRSSLATTYADLYKAQADLLTRYPELNNFYRTDALSHFLIGTDPGKELIGWEDDEPEEEEEARTGDRPWLAYPWLRKVTAPDWNFFLDECAKVITELGLATEDERLVLNLRNDRKRMSLNLLTRVFLAMNQVKTTTITVQLRADASDRYPAAGMVLIKAFKNEPKSGLFEMPIAAYRAGQAAMYPEMLAIARAQIARSGERSRQRMHHIPDLFPFVMDTDFRTKGLAYLLNNQGKWPAMANDKENDFLVTLGKFTEDEQRRYLEQVEDIVIHLGCNMGDERITFSCRRGSLLVLTVGQRYCLGLGSGERANYGFIVDEPGDEPDVEYGHFNGAGDPNYGNTDEHDRVREHWTEILAACKHELERTKRSSFRKFSNPYFERAVFDPAYRARILGGELSYVQKTKTMANQHPLNTILYGPPGTGKTYHAITHAVAIVDGLQLEAVKAMPREQVRIRFEELAKANRVRSVTFHQSFSYEDFIEGIKPETQVSKDGQDEVKLVTYDIQEGIFKLMCASARSGEGAGGGLDEATLTNASFYKVSLGQYNSSADDEIYDYCMAKGVIALGYGGSVDVSAAKNDVDIRAILKGAGMQVDGDGSSYTVSVLKALHLDMEVGDIVFVSAGNSKVRAIGRVSGGYFMDPNARIRFKQFRKVDWLHKDVDIPVEDIYGKAFVMGALYWLKPDLVKKDYFRKKLVGTAKRDGRYVLIIDEINRGNVASIFGELITLIEDDKREGGGEAARIRLPYSKEDLSVPSNLYLLGTMNTADRSVEALDTALRRRFSFVEMPSQPALVEPETVEGIAIRTLLTTINERVEQLLDKDHHIGHSYFMDLRTGDDMKRVFATKVIPLLEEYFHGDAKKVGAVLGEAFVEVRKKTIAFAKGFDMDEYEVKELYTVKDPRKFADLEPFKAIYASK